VRSAYSAQEFLNVSEYRNVNRWVDLIGRRPAVKRGQRVNRTFGASEEQLAERHDARDFDKLP
jgi:GST-like protein